VNDANQERKGITQADRAKKEGKYEKEKRMAERE
jgi:hypothetical protein